MYTHRVLLFVQLEHFYITMLVYTVVSVEAKYKTHRNLNYETCEIFILFLAALIIADFNKTKCSCIYVISDSGRLIYYILYQ